MSEPLLQERIKKFLNSALSKISAKDYDSAIEKLTAAEALDRDNPEILYNLGICYCRKELYNTAVRYFQKVRELPMTFVDVLTVIKMLSYSLIMSGDLKQAAKYTSDGLRLTGNDTTLLNMTGYILEKEKKSGEAIDIYKQIIDIDKNNFNAFNSIAFIIAETGGDLNEALEYSRKALRHKPENPAYLDTMGCIQMKKGQIDIAKRYLKKALEAHPDSKEIKTHINQLLKISPN